MVFIRGCASSSLVLSSVANAHDIHQKVAITLLGAQRDFISITYRTDRSRGMAMNAMNERGKGMTKVSLLPSLV